MSRFRADAHAYPTDHLTGKLARCAALPFAVAFALLLTTPARAASLTGPISGWASGAPAYISMYEYVPAKLAPNPPILVVSHYCGGNAAGVFGEAQGGGIVAAADQYGFLMIFPQTSNNCWDVGTTKSLTHDGGGDTQAVAEMVKYEISTRGADPNRVYATGTSSGAMMTEALLAVYPDLFKAGAEFSGVPAGCWSVNDSNGQWSSPCAGGMVTHTAQEWGDMVRAMYAGYSGYRPRIQLWHGTADSTINFNNQTEAIKEWTNVLGLSTNPTATSSVTFNNHPWNLQSWQDSCGFTVLEAWSEQNGPHGTDANLNATYVIPFLSLDKTGPDPQVAACGDAGPSASGSSSGSGGANSGATPDSGTGASGSSGTNGASSASSASGGGASGAASGSSVGSSASAASSGSNGGSGASGSSARPASGSTSSSSAASSASAGVASSASGSWQGDTSAHSGCGCSLPLREEGTRAGTLVAATLMGIVRRSRRRARA